jgi:Uma2 family endonuclease
MNVALSKAMSPAEFLAWEERQDLRYEFDGFQPVAMTGGTLGHDRITFNLHKVLDRTLAGQRCRPFGPNVKILAAGRVRYPDAIITCTPQDRKATVVSEPVVVFEVVSEGTSRTDRIDKVLEYQTIPSVRRYIIVEQDAIAATVFERTATDWVGRVFTGNAALAMPEVGIEIPLPELYADVELATPESGQPSEQTA